MFITIEGPEGAGKSTVARQLHARLVREGCPALLTYEPGGTDLGQRIREFVRHGVGRGCGPNSPTPFSPGGDLRLTGEGGTLSPPRAGEGLGERSAQLVPRAETLLFCAARAQLVDEVLRPHLRAGGVVICDRYADSTLAYQCYGRGLPLAPVRAVLAFATGGLWPDLTILLDVDVGEGLRRKREGGDEARADRFESQAIEFHARVRQGYLELAAADLQRWVVVDASRPLDQVVADAWEQIERRLQIEAGGTQR